MRFGVFYDLSQPDVAFRFRPMPEASTGTLVGRALAGAVLGRRVQR